MNEDRPHSTANSRIGSVVIVAVVVLAAALVALDGRLHRHAHVELEGRFGFYGWFSLLSTFVLAAAGWIARGVIRRREDQDDV